jgi:hypothetical protein
MPMARPPRACRECDSPRVLADFARDPRSKRAALAERGGELQFVNPAYTSQTCPEYGVVDATSRRSQSEFVCTACGHADHADVVGARNEKPAQDVGR